MTQDAIHKLGQKCYACGDTCAANPYPRDTIEYRAWLNGYRFAWLVDGAPGERGPNE